MVTVRPGLAYLVALAAALPAAKAACKHAPIGTATVAQVRDGRTSLLADGRELRLAAIEASPRGQIKPQELTAAQSLQL